MDHREISPSEVPSTTHTHITQTLRGLRVRIPRGNEDVSNHPVPITRNRGLGSKDGRQVFAESNGPKNGEERKGGSRARIYALAASPRVGVVARRD